MTRQSIRKWSAVGAVAGGLFAFGNLYQPVLVMGRSMEPTLHTCQLVWADRHYYDTHRPTPGDVIVFRHGRSACIKRVYRGPGETVYYRGAFGDVLLPVRESLRRRIAANPDLRGPRRLVKRLRVPQDHVFVVGDNADCSEDSRHFGPVPLESVIGKVCLERDGTKVLACEFVPKRGNRTWYARLLARVFGPPRRVAQGSFVGPPAPRRTD